MKKILPLLMLLMLCWSITKADTEPGNNAPGTTTDVIPLNGSQSGTIGTTDTDDYYKLATNADGNITISLTNTDNAYTYIYLYDSDGTTLLGTTSNYAGGGISFTVNGRAQGNYFVLVHYTGTPVSNYTLSNTFTAQSIANDAEPNDQFSQALTIAPNGSKTGHIGYLFNGGAFDGDDYYKLTTTTDGNITVNLTNNTNGYTYMYLYDNDGITQLGSTSNYAQAGISITVNGLSTGTYYIKVHNNSSADYSGYTLSNTITPATVTNDAEPDDLYTQGATITANGSKTGHMGYRYNGGTFDGDDYYKLTTTIEGNITVNLSNDNNGYTYIYLYDNDGTTQLGSTSNYALGGITFTVNGLSAGTYYIKVHTDASSNYSGYTVSNIITPATLTNDTEPNDVYTQAATIPVNGSKTGHIAYRYNGGTFDGDDYYKLVTTSDGDISLSITTDNGHYIYLYLYDSDGTTGLLSSSNYGTTGFTVNALAAGTYYIRVHDDANGNYNSYTLTNSLASTTTNETEPNNYFKDALPLNQNDSAKGHIGYRFNGGSFDSDDNYKLITTTDGNINISISNDNSHYMYIYLYDKDSTTLLGSSSNYGSTSFIVNGLAAGTYYVRVHVDGNGSYSTYTVYDNIIPAAYTNDTEPDDNFATATILNNDSAKSGHIGYRFNGGAIDNDDYRKIIMYTAGTLGIDVTMANTNYSYVYLYDPSQTQIFSQSNYASIYSIDFPTLPAGTYYLRVHADGASFNSYKITRFTVPCNQDASNITAGGPTTFCQGGSVTLHSTIEYATYTWSNGATTRDITVTTGSTYSLLGTDYDGCATHASNSIVVTVNPIPATPTISTGGAATTFCQGGSVTLTSSAATGNTWSTNATTQAITVSTSGSFTVAVTANGCTSLSSAPTVVTVNPLPATPTISAGGATTFCAGGSVTLTSSAATSYLWSNGATTQSITVNASGTFTVVVKNVNGCSSATSAATIVTVNPLPATPTIGASGATTFCAPGSVTLTSSAATSYLWSNAATTQSITVSSSGTFTVVVKNANGCSSAASTATVVTVNPLPTVTLSQFTAVCSTDAAFALSGGSPAGGTYSGTGVSGGQFNPATAGVGSFPITYSFTNANGCTNTATQSIIVNNCTAPCNASASAGGPTTFCAGGNVVLTASAGASYLWSNNATTQSITVTAGGNYSVAVTNASNCTATSNVIAVTVNPLPATPTISTGGAATTFCAGGSVTLTSSSATNNVWSTGATTQSITVNATGNYSVTVSNANNCSATSAATSVTVNPLPTVTLGQFAAKCSTDPAFALSGGSPAGGTYSGTGVSGGQFNPATAGVGTFTITYSYTNANNCTATAQQSITVNNCNPQCTAAATAGGPITFCAGGNVVLTASAGASYLWSNGATTASITVTATGNYSVAITNANNCTATSNVIAVTVNPLPATPTISAGGATTFCAGGSVTLTSSATTGNTWSNNATTQSITVNASGSFTVTVKNANNCSVTSAATVVTVNPLPTVTLAAFAAKCSTDAAFALSGGSPTGGTYSGTGVSGGQFNPATAGIGTFPITYSYTNANGCTNTATQSITVNNCNTVCTATITAGGPTTFCAGGSVKLTASAGASYLWSNGSTASNITVTAGGSFTVKITQSNACFATSAATVVTVNALPSVPTITASGPTTFCTPGSVTLTSSAATGNTWSNGATTQSITVTNSGSFTVKVTNANGCSATSATTVVTANNCGGTYCTASGTNRNKGYIKNVKFRTINNTTGWNNGYGDFTNLTAIVNKMTCYSISVTPGFIGCSTPLYTRVWIDWNHDGDFNDAGELVFAPAGASGSTRNGSISVPCNALSGTTRMRVEMRYDCNPSPCGTFTYGEVEDYTINVSGSTGRGIETEVADDIILTTTFNVYPNPVSDELIIQRTSNDNTTIVDANAKLQIADANGKIVSQSRLTKSTEVINVSRLSNGIYFVKIISDNGIITKRIMVSH